MRGSAVCPCFFRSISYEKNIYLTFIINVDIHLYDCLRRGPDH